MFNPFSRECGVVVLSGELKRYSTGFAIGWKSWNQNRVWSEKFPLFFEKHEWIISKPRRDTFRLHSIHQNDWWWLFVDLARASSEFEIDFFVSPWIAYEIKMLFGWKAAVKTNIPRSLIEKLSMQK